MTTNNNHESYKTTISDNSRSSKSFFAFAFMTFLASCETQNRSNELFETNNFFKHNNPLSVTAKKLQLQWGTYDSVIQNDQTIAIWVKIENPNDSGAVRIPFPFESYKLWVKTRDTTFLLGVWTDGGNWYPAKSAVYSILRFETFEGMPRIKATTNAKLMLTANLSFDISNPFVNILLRRPDNLALDKWYEQVASVLIASHKENFMAISKSGKSNWNSKGMVYKSRYEKCEYFRKWLDSLALNHLDSSVVQDNADRLLASEVCQDRSNVISIAIPNWPQLRDTYKCDIFEKRNLPHSKEFCLESKRKFNQFAIRIAQLTSQMPGDSYHKYKFQSKKGVVYLDQTTWRDSIPNSFEE